MHHWPVPKAKWDYPVAVEYARWAAIEFYNEKMAEGKIKVLMQRASIRDNQGQPVK